MYYNLYDLGIDWNSVRLSFLLNGQVYFLGLILDNRL